MSSTVDAKHRETPLTRPPDAAGPGTTDGAMALFSAIAGELFRSDSLEAVKNRAIARIVQAIEADGGLLIYSTTDRGVMRIVHHFSDVRAVEDAVLKSRVELMGDDPVFAALRQRLESAPAAVIDIADLEGIEAFRQSETYRKVYEQHGFRQVIVGMVMPVAGTVAIMALFRTDLDRRFRASDRLFVEAIMPMVGETVRRITLTDALVGRLGARPVNADLTLHDATPFDHFTRSPVHQTAADTVASSRRRSVLDNDVDEAELRLRLLSPRERQLTQMLAEGQTNPQIALQIGISRKTVEIHVSSILRKLELRNRTELAYLVQALNARGHELRALLMGSSKEQS